MNLNNLSYRHHKNSPYFFKNLSLELESGLIHALHGKNGIGKSILLHLLSGRTDKEAVIEGEISAENVALVTQRYDETLADHFTFLENLQFASLNRYPTFFSTLKTHEALPKLLEKFHIDLSVPVRQLSGGQRQILALLMQLQKEPQLLLLDEPTAALDEENAIMVFEFIKNLQGITILCVCHDQSLMHHYTTGKHLVMEQNHSGCRIITEVSPAS